MELLRAAVVEDATLTPMQVRMISIADEPVDRKKNCDHPATIAGVPPPEIVRRLQLIRTDLDEFSELEIDLLIRHGFTATVKALTGRLARTRSLERVWSPALAAAATDAVSIQSYSDALSQSQIRRSRLISHRDRTFPVPWILLLIALAAVGAAIRITNPFIAETIRSPAIDRLITGRPYRIPHVVRYVTLEPASLSDTQRAVTATTRLFYWLRLNRRIERSDSTFTEQFTPTYELEGSDHGLGVVGAGAIRESPGTLPFDTRADDLRGSLDRGVPKSQTRRTMTVSVRPGAACGHWQVSGSPIRSAFFLWFQRATR
jgi:hypothetical protein